METSVAMIQHLCSEAYRLRLLSGLDELLGDAGFARVAGVDEVGRGALAGPVVAAAVVVGDSPLVPGVDDSKALSAEAREDLAELISRSGATSSIAAVSADSIDRINILEATKRAMYQALEALDSAPDCAAIDAVRLDSLPYPHVAVVRGDAVSYSIAAASILAKVERDRVMVELDREYPQFGFARHKGYAAPEHLAALAEYGPCPEHRLTFRSVIPRLEEAA